MYVYMCVYMYNQTYGGRWPIDSDLCHIELGVGKEKSLDINSLIWRSPEVFDGVSHRKQFRLKQSQDVVGITHMCVHI